MKRIINFIIITAILASIAPACKKSLLDKSSQDAYSFDTYFSTNDAINQATIATYSTLLHQGLWSREYYFIFDLLGYEAKRTTNLQGDLAQLAINQYGSNQVTIGQLWGSLYRLIFRANVVIDRANHWKPSTAPDQQSAKQYIAEAKFLRAYAYFNLVTLWGDVPLFTAFDSTTNNPYPKRSPATDVWAFIETDLVSATPDLVVNYGPNDPNLGRATQGAAIALLGKAYLYEKKWALATTTFTKLTTSPFNYQLAPVYDSLFTPTNQGNPETIFQIMNGAWQGWAVGHEYYVFGGQETWGGKATHSDRAQEYGFNDWHNVYVSQAAVKAFSYPNPVNGTPYVDPRAYSTFYGDKPSGGDTVYCEQCSTGKISFPWDPSNPQGNYEWRKYEYYNLVKNLNGPQSTINGQVIRYADVKLMLAESMILQGNTGSQPLQLINDVRQRAGAVQYLSLGADQTSAMALLMRERQLELCGEQSRYFDLIRWGIARQVINAERLAEPGDGTQPFEDRNVLLPIPSVEKDYNPSIVVKDGWN